jgi:hypothetical protein
MRTRTSPRNQDILFNALFKPPSEPAPCMPTALESAQRALANSFLNPRTRRYYERVVDLERQRIAVRDGLAKENL